MFLQMFSYLLYFLLFGDSWLSFGTPPLTLLWFDQFHQNLNINSEKKIQMLEHTSLALHFTSLYASIF